MPLRFFHQLLTQQAEPAVVYYIRGTSTNVGGTETFNIQFIQDGAQTPDAAETITCAVDSNGDWEYSYSGKKIYDLLDFAYNKTSLLTVDFSGGESDEMRLSGTAGRGAFQGCTNLQSANFQNLTFTKIQNTRNMFYGCTNLQTVDFSNATFENVTNAITMFFNCENLETINWSNNLNFDKLEDTEISIGAATYNGMFQNCKKLTNASVAGLNGQTFKRVKNGLNLFDGCLALTKIDLHSATFESAASPCMTFANCTNLIEIDLSAATFANAIQFGYVRGGMFTNCSALVNIKLSSAIASKVYQTTQMFNNCNSLTTIDVPQNSTAILPTSTPANAPLDLHYSPLNYQSMLKVANWISDLTGQSAHTLTLNSSAFNALSAAEQANIQGLVTGKNWTLVLA